MLKTVVSTLLLLALTVAGAPSQLKQQAVNCGTTGYLNYGDTLTFTSPDLPNAYDNGLHCLWGYSSPPGTSFNLYCQYFDTAPSAGCNEDAFWLSPTGRHDMLDGVKYCGSGSVNVNTYGQYFAVRFLSQNDHPNTHLGFYCQLTVLPYNGQGYQYQTPNPNSNPSTTTVSPTTPGNGCDCGVKGASRIVGGQETAVNEWPWQVALRFLNTNDVYCGASLINHQWLVTAAHCVQPFTADSIYASLGDHNKNEAYESAYTVHKYISQIIVHENYDENTVDNDIAVLRLTTPVTYTDGVRPICLPFQYNTQNLSGETGVVTGWGTLTHLGDTSDVLMEVELPLLTTSECQEYSATSSITDNMFCTYEAGKDACQGDSGGPLQWEKLSRQYLVGLVSFGEGCGNVDSPGVYTKVANYLDWIEDKVTEDICHPTP